MHRLIVCGQADFRRDAPTVEPVGPLSRLATNPVGPGEKHTLPLVSLEPPRVASQELAFGVPGQVVPATQAA
ncbi:MAG: hypothetical protein DRG83_13620 [Deltaproteobacteria bacterium]|nr:MAG: hypothetical protein DRG83_13620 [Deltaproteobacteria bacterium]